MRVWIGTLIIALVSFAPLLWGQGANEGEARVNDYRSEVMLGFSAVFVLIVAYLIASYRRNAALKEDVEFLKSRLQNTP